MGNAGILQFFGNNDLTTTEYISKKLGKTRVEVSRTGEVGREQEQHGLSGKADVVDLVTAMNEAEMTLQTVVAVRDKVVQAYQEIMRMPI